MAINLGPVKPYVRQDAELLANMFAIRDAGGWRASDPFPDHPSGHAVDFMIPASEKAKGDALVAYIIANAKALGVKYLIWYRQSWNAKTGKWSKYTSTDNPHTDHVHVTWNDAAGTGDFTSVSASLANTSLPKPDLKAMFSKINDGAITLGVALLGLGLVGAGIYLTVSPKVAKAVNSLPGIGG